MAGSWKEQRGDIHQNDIVSVLLQQSYMCEGSSMQIVVSVILELCGGIAAVMVRCLGACIVL